MSQYNLWLPGNAFFGFNEGVTTSLGYRTNAAGQRLLAQTFVIPNKRSGFGITFDQISPPFQMTKPPKLYYTSTSAMTLTIKDSDGWNWNAPCPFQATAKERGWAWSQFTASPVQENVGELPNKPATGMIRAFQFSGAEGVHGPDDNAAQSISISYLAGRSPSSATAGNIRTVVLTDRNPLAHTWKVGQVELARGTRKEVKYIGSLPFGLQMNGPRNRLSSLPYRGPIIAGYQSGTPWISAGNNDKLGHMLDFMDEAQSQFHLRSPTGIYGPWMHIYLQALWDCEQNGLVDSWVWDGPDGNPAWDGWQYRAFDGMSRTWYEATIANNVTPENMNKMKVISTRFLDWLYNWFMQNLDTDGVPNDWRPEGWTQGTPLAPERGLEPKFTFPAAHDIALALKGTVFCTLAGYDGIKGRYVIHRLMRALIPLQVVDPAEEYEMRGAFTLNPTGFEVYGFEQGEILEALALCVQHPNLMLTLPAG
jgi:hypothetical protein